MNATLVVEMIKMPASVLEHYSCDECRAPLSADTFLIVNAVGVGCLCNECANRRYHSLKHGAFLSGLSESNVPADAA